MSARARRPRERAPRRQRSATGSLLSVVLVLESLLAFFLALVVYALDILDPVPALAGGGALFLVFIVCSRLVRYRVGLWLGFGLQAVLIACGILVPFMYLIGVGFLALWLYCFVTGRRLDQRNGRRLDGTMI